jgi:hypothetical protein
MKFFLQEFLFFLKLAVCHKKTRMRDEKGATNPENKDRLRRKKKKAAKKTEIHRKNAASKDLNFLTREEQVKKASEKRKAAKTEKTGLTKRTKSSFRIMLQKI